MRFGGFHLPFVALSLSGNINAASQNWNDWKSACSGVQVQTNTGLVTGFINETAPDVRQFLNIPYGAPPVGANRWMPPVPVNTTKHDAINATKFPPSCPQYASKIPSIYYLDVPEWTAVLNTQEQYAKTSEDCLSLAVWTPKNVTAQAKLPVIMFMTGGHFIVGGVDIPYQLPYQWVQRSQSHIVVTINYRLGIFGFPNAKGLDSQNLGILDQRLALEWVRDNIEAFGGDASRITLWGQSAGGQSVDIHNFAFPHDIIASGLFMDSGSVFLQNTYSTDHAKTNFTFVASQFGCKGSNQSVIECMQKVNFQDIVNFAGSWTDNKTLTNHSLPSLYFGPIADEKIVYSNYTKRYEMGAFSNRPAVFTTNSLEGTALVPYPKDPTVMGPNQTLVAQTTLGGFTCPAALSEALREKANLTTYRWQFAGNFSNISPRFWMGAYHVSDIALTMGTHPDFRGNSTQLEYDTSENMQDYALSFMRDPIKGPASLGWRPTTSKMLLRFGLNGTGVQMVNQTVIDGACATYKSQLS